MNPRQLARKRAKEYLRSKLGDRKGFHVFDIKDTDILNEIIEECAEAFYDFAKECNPDLE